MPSSRFSLGFSVSSLLSALVLAAGLVACGGNPEVSNPGDDPMGVAGSDTGVAGKGNDGPDLMVPDAGVDDPDASQTVPEAGPGCGDGEINQDDEKCDDGNTLPGDGCSGACTIEPNWECAPKNGPCHTTIVCGDGKIAVDDTTKPPTEIEACDDGNTEDGDGCSSDCLIKDPLYNCDVVAMMCINTVVCGDKQVTGEENCDDGNKVSGDGCSADCNTVEPNYICGKPGTPCKKIIIPVCGDGVLDSNEECDDGNTASTVDGCTADCKLITGWVCPAAGKACLQQICGNGVRTPDEQCDDGNTAASDGCGADCKVELDSGTMKAAWVCPTPGQLCLPKCGDGKKYGYEQCEDGNTKSGDGCSVSCLIEPGYVCGAVGTACTKAICGQNGKEADEGCDDGNLVYGDGCSGICQNEPTFSAAGDAVIACGDGIHTSGEGCDDGNKNSGDGCSLGCTVETGFKCSDVVTTPDFIDIAVTYHDFKANGEVGGHIDFENKNGGEYGITGDVCTKDNTATCGKLGTDGKPQYNSTKVPAVTQVASAASFAQWYKADPINKEVKGSIRMARQGLNGAVYAYDNSAFFPLDGDPNGFGLYGNSGHDFHFTTELDYFFQYNGGEVLTFRGDDDVWVFINNKLAVDIGGIHGAAGGRVILGDVNSTCTVNNGTVGACTPAVQNNAADVRFGLVKGGIYKISFFQAERHTNASNFRLTLSNFLPPHSQCLPDCGDGKIVIGEVCDDGTAQNTGAYGHCNATCTARDFCGDGVKNGPEICDNGTNLASYGSTSGCAPGCVLPPKCGDSTLDVAFHEECDLGTAKNTGAYDGCTAACKLGPYCGDGTPQTPQEVCDKGSANGGYGKECGYDCQPGAYCGDGFKNGSEQCDLGDGKNLGGYAGCNANCTYGPKCGDHVVNGEEQCDDGVNAGGYGKCAPGCKYGARCGDGIKNGSEQCDDGVNDGSYGKCNKDCKFGPRCGDGVVQKPETCDNGAQNGKGDCSSSCTLQVTK